MQFSTRAIHSAQDQDSPCGAVIAPLYLTSTFAPPGDFQQAAYDYSRTKNPTRYALEETLAALEEGVGALAYASGMAAIHGALMLLKSGDHVLAGRDIYGGTYRILFKVLDRVGIKASLVDLSDTQAVTKALRPETKMIWAENPGNPLLSLCDLAELAKIAHQHGAWLAVDNTFATPLATKPLLLGADLVIHSLTKFMGGHSDLLGGALVVSDSALLRELHFLQNATGSVMAPLDAYLCSRGIKTLAVRFREQVKSTQVLAERLAKHPLVKKVFYPGLPSHPQHKLACQQLSGLFGSILSFELELSLEETSAFVKQTKLFQRAVSVGAVESLIEQPATMSHASYDKKDRKAADISDSLVRLSIGLEAAEDLWRDLEHALQTDPSKLIEPSALGPDWHRYTAESASPFKANHAQPPLANPS